MKYTKGNWHTHDGQIYPEETGKTLAIIPYWATDEEQAANAQLIAAAPEMFHALVESLAALKSGYIQDRTNATDLILKAIAKAEGKI